MRCFTSVKPTHIPPDPRVTHLLYCLIFAIFSLPFLIPGSPSSVRAHLSTLKVIKKKTESPRFEDLSQHIKTLLRCPGGKCAGPCATRPCCAVAPCTFQTHFSVAITGEMLGDGGRRNSSLGRRRKKEIYKPFLLLSKPQKKIENFDLH